MRSPDGLHVFDIILMICPVSEISCDDTLLCGYRDSLGRSLGVSVVARANGQWVGSLS